MRCLELLNRSTSAWLQVWKWHTVWIIEDVLVGARAGGSERVTVWVDVVVHSR